MKIVIRVGVNPRADTVLQEVAFALRGEAACCVEDSPDAHALEIAATKIEDRLLLDSPNWVTLGIGIGLGFALALLTHAGCGL